MKQFTYSDRIAYCKNPTAKKLLAVIQQKESNLSLAADVTTSDKLLALADACGPYISVLKTHIDIIEDFTPSLIPQLKSIADKHHFLIFEDRKFADIGTTVRQQYQGGVYHIADWADIINAHSLPGPGIVTGLAEIGLSKQRGLLLLAEMSSANHLFSHEYTERTRVMAEEHAEFVFGYISQHRLSPDPAWIYFTPGIQFTEKTALHGQQYNDPHTAIVKNGTDIIIVGRGIFQADAPELEAKKYRDAGWQAYLERLVL